MLKGKIKIQNEHLDAIIARGKGLMEDLTKHGAAAAQAAQKTGESLASFLGRCGVKTKIQGVLDDPRIKRAVDEAANVREKVVEQTSETWKHVTATVDSHAEWMKDHLPAPVKKVLEQAPEAAAQAWSHMPATIRDALDKIPIPTLKHDVPPAQTEPAAAPAPEAPPAQAASATAADEPVSISAQPQLAPPFSDYDELSAKDVVARLEGLDPAQLTAIRDYEAAVKNRVTIIKTVEKILNPSEE